VTDAVVGGDGAASQLAGRAVLIGMTIAMPPEFDSWMRSAATIRAASQLAVSAAVHQDDDRMRPEFD
jgi:hypothetical protein